MRLSSRCDQQTMCICKLTLENENDSLDDGAVYNWTFVVVTSPNANWIKFRQCLFFARLSIIASFLSSILIQVAALSEFAYHCDYYSLPDLPTERFPERVFQLSLYEILFLLWLLSIHPKLKNEIAKCEVQTGERQNQNYASSFNISY